MWYFRSLTNRKSPVSYRRVHVLTSTRRDKQGPQDRPPKARDTRGMFGSIHDGEQSENCCHATQHEHFNVEVAAETEYRSCNAGPFLSSACLLYGKLGTFIFDEATHTHMYI